MTNQQVAEKWRKQIKDEGHSMNMFFEHDVLYSYGYHFPMAIITDKRYQGQTIVVQNSYGYSNSTAKHLNYMRGQCYNDAVITIGTPLLKKLITPTLSRLNMNEWKKEARTEIEARKQEQEKKLSKARANHMKESYKKDIEANNLQLEIVKSL